MFRDILTQEQTKLIELLDKFGNEFYLAGGREKVEVEEKWNNGIMVKRDFCLGVDLLRTLNHRFSPINHRFSWTINDNLMTAKLNDNLMTAKLNDNLMTAKLNDNLMTAKLNDNLMTISQSVRIGR